MLRIKKSPLDFPTRDTKALLGLHVEHAFDNIQHQAILKAISDHNLGTRFYLYVKAFLEDRTATLRTGGTFNGTHIRVTALNWLPWLMLDCSSGQPRESMYGPMANIIEVLSYEGGFTYDITCSEGGGTGMVFPNGSWTGLVGDVYRNRADLALGPMSITYDRIHVVTFPPQIITEYLTILAGLPDRVEANAFGNLMVFQWQVTPKIWRRKNVWIVLLLCLMVCVLTSVLVELGSCTHPSNKPMRQLVADNWWMYISTTFMEPSTHAPRSTPGRLVLAAWWLTIVVLMNAFSGHMKATMMLFPEPERIDSFMDLSLQTDVTPFLWRGGAYEDLLKKSLDVKEYRGVWNLIVARDGLRDEAQLYSDANLELVLNGKAVIVSDYTTMLYHASRTCQRRFAAGKYYFAKEPTFPTPLAMAVSRSVEPRLTKFISERVSWLVESGVVKAWIERQLGDWQSCLLGDDEETCSPLSLFDMRSAFLLFLTSTCFSVFVFIGELLIAGWMKRTQKRQPVWRVKQNNQHSSARQHRRKIELM
ncbi:glutamate receptor ionotropic, kainate 1-like [Dermacentor variabilis]|uniref:glutamate receptor ionotropic, kainate 1-like n=1 Tax=Dermacentor variabilis TaxID=34621 RepID=UPI003F5B559D